MDLPPSLFWITPHGKTMHWNIIARRALDERNDDSSCFGTADDTDTITTSEASSPIQPATSRTEQRALLPEEKTKHELFHTKRRLRSMASKRRDGSLKSLTRDGSLKSNKEGDEEDGIDSLNDSYLVFHNFDRKDFLFSPTNEW